MTSAFCARCWWHASFMASYAVVIVGVPARVADTVLRQLKADLATAHIVLADRSPEHRTRYALYDSEGVNRALDTCTEAVFNTRRRPISFCRHPARDCGLQEGRRSKNCGKTDTQMCGRARPEHLLVFYQQSQDDDPLLRALSFSAYACRLASNCYGHPGRTLEAIRGAIAQAKDRVRFFSPSIRGYGRTPFLLPLANYKPKAVISFLSGLARNPELGAIDRFLEKHWSGRLSAYVREDDLAFKPTKGALAHGGSGEASDARRLLATEYRMGVSYDPGFHYDVSSTKRHNLDGISWRCCLAGPVTCGPRDGYVNIYPNDLVRRTPR